MVTQVIAFEGDGLLREYVGGYSDWVLAQSRAAAPQLSSAPQARVADKAAEPAPQRQRSVKLSYNETRELAALPQQIETLEQESAGLNQQLLDPDLFRTDPARGAQIHARVEEIELQLLEMLARWEELESRQKG